MYTSSVKLLPTVKSQLWWSRSVMHSSRFSIPVMLWSEIKKIILVQKKTRKIQPNQRFTWKFARTISLSPSPAILDFWFITNPAHACYNCMSQNDKAEVTTSDRSGWCESPGETGRQARGCQQLHIFKEITLRINQSTSKLQVWQTMTRTKRVTTSRKLRVLRDCVTRKGLLSRS